MTTSARDRLHLGLAAVQAFGAALASLSLLGVRPELFRRSPLSVCVKTSDRHFYGGGER